MSDQTFRRPIKWESYALTDVGCVRKVNEDAILEAPEKNMWVVADGMGGHHVGDVASKKIIEGLQQLSIQDSLGDCVEVVEDAILQVNQQLLDYAKEAFGSQTMGSTVVCLVIVKHIGVCLWAGDSRLYRYRNQQLQQLSRDHSQVAEMVNMGLISEEEAEIHPHRNVITRAVGVEEELFLELNIFGVQVGDTYLLCSDGLYNAVCNQDIESALSDNNVEEVSIKLLKQAIENDAQDNVSVIVVKGYPSRLE